MPVPTPLNAFRHRLLLWLALCLTAGFLMTSLASYYTSKLSIRSAIADTELPLTADNIYSEIQRDLVQPIVISSLMANDSFVRQWVLQGERDVDAMTRYLAEIKREYKTITAFFISNNTFNYYHADGKHRDVNATRESDKWYFRARELNLPYEVNVDIDKSNNDTMTVFINYRVQDFDGRFIGITGVGLTVEQMTDRIRNYQLKYGREVFFTDAGRHIVLSASHRFLRDSNLNEYPELAEWQIQPEQNSTLQYTQANEVHQITARYIPDLHWTLFVDKAETTALEPIQRTLNINLLVSFVVTLMVLILVQRLVSHYQQRLEQLAVTDPLTGFHNRLGFNLLLKQFVAEMKRDAHPACALLIDVDHFKQFNDRYGHLVGDNVLQHVAAHIRNGVRASDIVCRWGGEEFLVLARDCVRDDAQQIAEKILNALRDHPYVIDAENTLLVTASVGISEWQRDETPEAFFGRADMALYDAKQSGRDRVK